MIDKYNKVLNFSLIGFNSGLVSIVSVALLTFLVNLLWFYRSKVLELLHEMGGQLPIYTLFELYSKR